MPSCSTWPRGAARAVGVREVGGALWSAVRMSLARPDASLTTATTHTSQHNSHARSTMETLRRFRFHGSEQESPRPMSPAHPLSSFIPIHIPYGCCWAGAPSQIGGFRPTVPTRRREPPKSGEVLMPRDYPCAPTTHEHS